ncbi:prepilin-type N-terminal cleavage/methylation domain-containing protein [Luteimonas sp. MC1782]|nr:prepilin-type N-terminal cleavage/methylation domain-containing protein [Luteimonas sp. MC1782]
MRRARASGFTLIEVLLATVLLAMGLALAFATLRASMATSERGEAMASRTDRMRAVEGFLRRRLASAQPIAFATDESTGGALRFIGETDRIRFVADLPDYLGRGGPHLHDIGVDPGSRTPVLGASFAMVLAGETIEEERPRPPEPLVEDLVDLRFRYRGLDDEGLTGWLDTWDNHEELPLQVAVEISSEDGGAWPLLVVALPQSASGAALGQGLGSTRMRRPPAVQGSDGAGKGGRARNRLRPLPGRR